MTSFVGMHWDINIIWYLNVQRMNNSSELYTAVFTMPELSGSRAKLVLVIGVFSQMVFPETPASPPVGIQMLNKPMGVQVSNRN